MHSSQILSILAFASTTVALPQWGNWGSGQQQGNWDGHDSAPEATVTAIATATAYTTVVYGGNWGGQAQPTEAPAAPATPVAASTWATWSASPSAVASAVPTTGGSSSDYMSVVNEWRSKMGHPTLTEDSTLQANSLKTVQDGNGQMVHELNPGSMAQVLAPGSADDFTAVYVGGWLCEVPSASGLDGICNTMSAGWSYDGQTGHADILNSQSYTKIGCAIADGIWGCDLA